MIYGNKEDNKLNKQLINNRTISVVFAGVDVGDRWQQLCQFWESHADEHFLVGGVDEIANFFMWWLTKVTQFFLWFLQAFNDSHMLMTTLGAKNEALTMKLLDSLRKYVRWGFCFH